ncbi:MAG: type II toxin-antitoxin system YafQ family toxin [Chloroflexi bacterium]|nr:type II toxin-antitoxin system YafQ family toxin [Chloroflexota bacterium]
MRLIVTLTQFEKDTRLMRKRGKDLDKLQTIVKRLANDESLEPRYRDHPLSGGYQGRRECHIEPNWLLIYRFGERNNSPALILERTGTHSDLFG